VQEFTPGGVFVRAWGRQNLNQTNLKPDDFYGPRGIAAGPNGDIYVADTGHKRIQVFDATGHFLRGIGQPGSAIGQLNEPSSVTVDKHGHLYVADFWNSRIQAFDTASGAYVSSFVVSAWQSGGYDEPHIAVDDRGRLFLPDPAGGRMLVYSTAGKPLYGWGSGLFVKPLAVVTGRGGQVLVTDSGNNSLTVFTAP
jgi:sugar lactone lactonase YvrE